MHQNNFFYYRHINDTLFSIISIIIICTIDIRVRAHTQKCKQISKKRREEEWKVKEQSKREGYNSYE